MPALLDPRWEAACKARADGYSADKAHKMAGYKGGQTAATMFFKRLNIARRVTELLEARRQVDQKAMLSAAERLSIDKYWVLERLKYNAEIALRGVPVLDENGVQTGRFMGRQQHNAATRALTAIGKELGMFVERIEIGGPGEFASMSDSELTEKARQDALALGMAPEAVEKLLLTFQPQDDESVE